MNVTVMLYQGTGVEFHNNVSFYCATIAYHVRLNANSGGRRTPANDQEKWMFGKLRISIL